jgi:hypothetical protein
MMVLFVILKDPVRVFFLKSIGYVSQEKVL